METTVEARLVTPLTLYMRAIVWSICANKSCSCPTLFITPTSWTAHTCQLSSLVSVSGTLKSSQLPRLELLVLSRCVLLVAVSSMLPAPSLFHLGACPGKDRMCLSLSSVGACTSTCSADTDTKLSYIISQKICGCALRKVATILIFSSPYR